MKLHDIKGWIKDSVIGIGALMDILWDNGISFNFDVIWGSYFTLLKKSIETIKHFGYLVFGYNVYG